MTRLLFFTLVCLSLLNTSCTRIFYKVYGIELAEKFDKSKYESTLAQL